MYNFAIITWLKPSTWLYY